MTAFYINKSDKDTCFSCTLDDCEPTSNLCPIHNKTDEELETRAMIATLIKEKFEDKRTREAIRTEIRRVQRMGLEADISANKQKARKEVARLKKMEEDFTRRIKNLTALRIPQKMEVPLTLVTSMQKTRNKL